MMSCASTKLSNSELKQYNKLSDKAVSEKALSFFNRANYKKAISAYSVILNRKNPQKTFAAWATYEIGYCYYYMKDFKSAKIYFEKVIKNFQGKEHLAPRLLALQQIEKIKKKKTQGI